MAGISVTFPGVKALQDVDFRLFPGEVHALLGENGAGKSTLIKALTGVYRIDSGGAITLGGSPISVRSPAHARELGISTVYQEVNLVTNLSVAENIMLGREPRRFGRIDWSAMRQRARTALERLHLDIDPHSMLETHSLAVQQLVSLARAVEIEAKVLILDEPTSSLDASEVAELFAVVEQIRGSGVAVLFVTHFLDQVYAIADRITVLRNGRKVSERFVTDLPRLQLVSLMMGRELASLDDLHTQRGEITTAAATEPLLVASGIGRRGAVKPLDLTIHPGDVVGLAGLLGSGRTEVARLLYGADRLDEGAISIGGATAHLRSPRAALDAGIALASENRRSEGVIADLTVRENIIIAVQAGRGWARPMSRGEQLEIARRWIAALDIRPTNPEAVVGNLSGGNQQKVLLARWLLTGPKLLILDEPTRGIDVGAKAEILRLVTGLAADGTAVLFISAELEEVLRLADRVVVMRDHSKVAELINDDLTVDDVLATIAADAPTEPVTA